jgi:3-oxoacyl-[acyl-carrier-protein] synthase-1
MTYLTYYKTAYTEQSELLEDLPFPQRVHWFPETYKRVNLGLTYPPHKLAEKVLDAEILKELRDNPKKSAFILASGNAHFAGINPRANDTQLSYQYKFLPFTLTQVYAGRIAQSCGATDYISTDASACASSLKVMFDVKMLMSVGFERVIVLAVEDAVSNSVLEFFGEAGACLRDEDVKPSAFDSQNYGFYVGQGAAFCVFEKDPSIKPIGKLISAYTASEPCDNAIGQREDGLGFKRAIEGVLEGSSITVVKTHGTGTKSNNIAERNALSGLTGFKATSFKPKIGHTMGASGLLETLMLLESLQKGVIPKIENRTEEDSVFLSEDATYNGGQILSLAAGMGNIYSSALFEV